VAEGDVGYQGRAELDCAQKASSPHFWAQSSPYSVQEWRERNPRLAAAIRLPINRWQEVRVPA